MKIRIEKEGLHLYDRKSGTHILFDEFETNESDYTIAPRAISIAITDKCDFHCPFCYVNLKDRFLDKNVVLDICRTIDNLGSFDVAFGGGEPTLHPNLIEICQQVWNNTKLGISITTHGHNLTNDMINSLMGYISVIRISIDGVEPVYSQFRDKPLDELIPKIEYLKGRIPFAVNTVVNGLTLNHLDEIREFCLRHGAVELLLLPMMNKNKFTLNAKEWSVLENWIKCNYEKLPIRLSTEAKSVIEVPYLFNNSNWENDYAFIGIDLKIRENSFVKEGIRIEDYPLNEVFTKFRINRNSSLQQRPAVHAAE
jgi:MoaA/NifB/PqqE/SkfB family radical SAM enzyme